MAVRIVHDPIENPRWAELLDRHPSASIFHSPGWLNALRQTYGYEPFVVTTSTGSTLENGLVACRGQGMDVAPAGVAAVLRSLRSVSGRSPPISRTALTLPARTCTPERLDAPWRCVRRPVVAQAFAESPPMSADAERRLLLSPTRPARRGDRDLPAIPSLEHAAGHSSRRARRPDAMNAAHPNDCSRASTGLLRMTRRRHGLPPQPLAWFRNLIACLGDRRVDSRREQGRATDRRHPDAVVQEARPTTSTAAPTPRTTVWAACRSCSGV